MEHSPRCSSLVVHALLSLVVLHSFHPSAGAPSVPAIIVFGDSTVDPGNNNYLPTIARSNFPPYGRDFEGGQPTGRFCNGRLATDFISESFGLRPIVPAYLDPAFGIEDFAVGVSFASAGTGFDNVTSRVLGVMPLWRQLELFKEYLLRLIAHLGEEKAKATITEALYLISMGTNDFLENYYTPMSPRQAEFSVDKYGDFLLDLATGFFRNIHRLGARKINFPSLSPMGCLPLVRTTTTIASGGCGGCNEEYNRVAREFNEKIQALVKALNAELPGLKLVSVDTYTPFERVLQQPYRFGFVDWMTGCCATGLYEMGYACDQWNPYTCRDARKYVFWDAIHPSEAMNRILAFASVNGSLNMFI